MTTISGTGAIIFRIITPFVDNPARMYLGAVSLMFFMIYWPTCLQFGGLSPGKDAEEEG